jgi:hypothetical protein
MKYVVLIIGFVFSQSSFACDQALVGKWECSRDGNKLFLDLNYEKADNAFSATIGESLEEVGDRPIASNLVMNGEEVELDSETKTSGICSQVEEQPQATVTTEVSSFITLKFITKFTATGTDSLKFELVSDEDDDDDGSMACSRVN